MFVLSKAVIFLVSQGFPAERQADRDGPREAGQTGVAERDQRDRGGEAREKTSV